MSILARTIESLIFRFTTDGGKTFFEPDEFSWIASIEAGFGQIRSELEALLTQHDRIPNFQDISVDQARLTQGTQWKTFFFWAYGKSVDGNRALCPQTDLLLRQIPGMKTAMFSILAAHKHIPEHKGPYKGVLRYHLGLLIPKPESQCRIRVGQDVRSWHEGKSLVFDDSHPHEVWNDANAVRVVLFVDFLRPLPLPLALLNRLVVWIIANTRYVTTGIRRARQASREFAEP
jgi:ornithine lipid ester-linked acyl 2-hydroxylase